MPHQKAHKVKEIHITCLIPPRRDRHQFLQCLPTEVEMDQIAKAIGTYLKENILILKTVCSLRSISLN